MDNIKEPLERITTSHGDVLVSNEEIPLGAKYVAIEDNPLRYIVVYGRHYSGISEKNAKLLKATVLPCKIKDIPAVEPNEVEGIPFAKPTAEQLRNSR